MDEGYDFESFQARLYKELGEWRARSTLFAWKQKDHASYQADFAEAYEMAKSCNLMFWEKQGIEGLYTVTEISEDGKTKVIKSQVSTGVWALNMRNRHGWKDKIEVSGPDNQPLVLGYALKPKENKGEGASE